MAGRCSEFMDLNLLWKCLCLHLRIFRALQVREDGKCRSGGGPWGLAVFTGLWEGGNNTCTKSSKDAELGGFGNTREDREVRKNLQENTKAQFGKCKANPSGGDWGRAAAHRGCSCDLCFVALSPALGTQGAQRSPRVLQSSRFVRRSPLLLVCGSRVALGMV